jgi:hypothetical protein
MLALHEKNRMLDRYWPVARKESTNYLGPTKEDVLRWAANILAKVFRVLSSPSRGRKLHGWAGAHFGKPICRRQSKQQANFVGLPIFWYGMHWL